MLITMAQSPASYLIHMPSYNVTPIGYMVHRNYM